MVGITKKMASGDLHTIIFQEEMFKVRVQGEGFECYTCRKSNRLHTVNLENFSKVNIFQKLESSQN